MRLFSKAMSPAIRLLTLFTKDRHQFHRPIPCPNQRHRNRHRHRHRKRKRKRNRRSLELPVFRSSSRETFVQNELTVRLGFRLVINLYPCATAKRLGRTRRSVILTTAAEWSCLPRTTWTGKLWRRTLKHLAPNTTGLVTKTRTYMRNSMALEAFNQRRERFPGTGIVCASIHSHGSTAFPPTR